MIITDGIPQEELKEMFFVPVNNLQQAINDSVKLVGEQAKFIFIPHGSDIITEVGS